MMEVEILLGAFLVAKKIENEQPDLVAWRIVFFKKDFKATRERLKKNPPCGERMMWVWKEFILIILQNICKTTVWFRFLR
jgi:hypothetical protein